MTLVVSKAAAKQALAKDATGASACLYGIEALLGTQWMVWEPQTLWIELSKQGIDISEGNRSQIMAARALISTQRFWYDANVFEKTCTAFNNEEIQADALEDAPVAYITWAVWEAEEILKHHELSHDVEFDREPIEYTGVQLFREGFVIPPPGLSWASAALDKHYPSERKELQSKIRKAWAAAPSSDKLKDAAYPETLEGVQLARLAAVQRYFDARKKSYLKDLAALQA